MRSQADHDSSDIPVVIGRRSARLSVIVPLTIRGVAPNGKAFKENTWTISINKQGARLFAFHEPSVGDEITLENPVLGRTAKGRVVRVCEKRFPEDPYEIAVELSDAQNVWGVKFPPEDWQKERPITAPSQPAAKSEKTSILPPGLGAQASAATRAEEPSLSATGSAAAPKGANGQVEKFDQVNLAITGLSRFARQADEVAGKPAAPGEERPFGEIGSVPPAYYQEALRLLEDRIKKVRSLERDLDTLGGRIENSRTELEGLLGKIREAGKEWQEAAEKIRLDIREASEQALHSSLEKVKLRIQEDIAAASSAVLEKAQKRFQEESTAEIDGLLRSAQTRLTGFSEEWFSKSSSGFQATKDEFMGKAQAEFSNLMEAHASGLRDSYRKQAEEISASLLKEVEKSLEAAAQSARAKYAESLKGQAESARRDQEASFHQILHAAQQDLIDQIAKGEEKLQSLGERVVKTTKASLAESSQEAAEVLRTTASETLAQVGSARQKLDEISREVAENFRKRLAEVSTKSLEGSRNYTETQFRGLRAELDEALRQTQAHRLQEAGDRLQKLSEETLQSLAAQLQKATRGELERIEQGLAAAEKKAFEELHKQLSAVGQSTVESLVLDAKATSEEYRAHLRKVFLECQERGERDLLAHLRSTLDRQREAVGEQLRREAGAAGERISAEIMTLAERTIKEASDTMYKQVGVATVTMKGWTDDARAQVESYLEKSFADLQRRVSELSAASLTTFHSELRLLAENLSARLADASRLFQGLEKVPAARPEKGPSQTIHPELAGSARQRPELSAQELRARAEQVSRNPSGSPGHQASDPTTEPERHPKPPNNETY
jgi:DNA anti-recombination protein RmuC